MNKMEAKLYKNKIKISHKKWIGLTESPTKTCYRGKRKDHCEECE